MTTRTVHMGGHRLGGLLCLGLLVQMLAGCGAGGPKQPGPERGSTVGRPLDSYRQLGLVAGTAEYPVVASFSTFAGPADSTLVLFGLSLPNSALRFQRDGQGFIGEYTVTLTFKQAGEPVKRVERREVVRIASFAETGRTEESVVFQHMVTLPPGEYEVEIATGDAYSSRGYRTNQDLTVPSYGAVGRRVADPLPVYRAEGRATQSELPDMIANPRRTVAYGMGSPLLYVEAYGVESGYPVSIRVLDDRDTELWQTRVALDAGNPEVRYAAVEIPPSALPLGRLWVEVVGEPDGERFSSRSPLIITISDQWMVANFDEVLEFLSYIATDEELDALKNAEPSERRERWEQFWARRDPVPATPMNEFREQFFERVRVATEQFGEPGREGWRTHRGEVYIVLGVPDQAYERQLQRMETAASNRTLIWIYERTPVGRLELIFEDRTGFGRYELTPSSQAAFRSAAGRLRQRR